jgi:exopolysaccharide biosynthesis polyprenyl glycosylphosphotransferase
MAKGSGGTSRSAALQAPGDSSPSPGARRVCLLHGDPEDRSIGIDLCANGHGPASPVAFIPLDAEDGWSGISRSVRSAAPFDEILIVGQQSSRDSLLALAQRCLAFGVPVHVASARFSSMTRRAPVVRHSGIPVLALRGTPQRGLALGVKRVVDVAGAALGLVFLMPLLLVIAAAIKLTSRGPVLYRQVRIGKDGAAFTFYKFRSMIENCEENPHREYFEQFVSRGEDASIDNGGSKVFKLVDDPRITRVGRTLRRTSLDELPQLWNVLRGEMSLVGPRPSLPYEWDAYKDWQRARLSVVPGCTGLWQVMGRSRVSFDEMVLLDLCYIANWSLAQDFALIARTFPVMFFGRGGH